MDEISNKTLTIIEQVLDVDLSNAEDISPENIPQWDSLAHLSIVISLQDEFHIAFNVAEIGDMLAGYRRIIDIIKGKGIK